MNVSIRDAMIFGAGYPSLLEGCRDLGVKAVEILLDRQMKVSPVSGKSAEERLSIASPVAVSDYRVSWQYHQLTPTAFLLATNFGAPDVDAEIDWCVKAVEAADHLGMSVIRIDPIMTGERTMPLSQRIERVAQAIRAVFERTPNSQVALGIENHGLQGNDPAFLQALLEGVGSPRLGLTMDTGNFYWSGKPLSVVYSILEELAPYARHTHCKNIKYPPVQREKEREIGWSYATFVCPLDEGDIDHRRVVQFLSKAGYQGDLCVEDESMAKYSQEVRRNNLSRSLAYLYSLAQDALRAPL